MTSSADTCRSVCQFSRIALGELHELGKALEGRHCGQDQEVGKVGDGTEGRALTSGVIGQVSARNRIEWNGHASQQHGVAIRSRLSYCRRPRNRKPSGFVLDDDRLSPSLLEALRQQAGLYIGNAAG